MDALPIGRGPRLGLVAGSGGEPGPMAVDVRWRRAWDTQQSTEHRLSGTGLRVIGVAGAVE